jgi:hypothetical protein
VFLGNKNAKMEGARGFFGGGVGWGGGRACINVNAHISCCIALVSTLVDDVENGANALHDFGALFLWDVRLGKDHGETRLISLELGVMPCLVEESLVYLIICGHAGVLLTYRETCGCSLIGKELEEAPYAGNTKGTNSQTPCTGNARGTHFQAPISMNLKFPKCSQAPRAVPSQSKMFHTRSQARRKVRTSFRDTESGSDATRVLSLTSLLSHHYLCLSTATQYHLMAHQPILYGEMEHPHLYL